MNILKQLLGMKGGQVGVDQLVQNLANTKDAGQQEQIGNMLAGMGSPAVGPLMKLLTDPSSVDIQQVILDILGKVGGPAMGPLSGLLDSSGDDALKDMISKTLDGMQK